MSELSKTIRKHPLVENSNLTENGKTELANEIAKEEYLEIKKPNIITQRGKFNFNSLQQDLVNFMFWKFDEVDYENKTLKLECEEIRKICKFSKGGKTNKLIKNTFAEIQGKNIWLPVNDPKIEEETFQYLKKVKVEKGTGDIILEFDPQTLDFLILGATKYFTLYNFFDIFKLEGKYAKRLFELLSSFTYKTNQFTSTLENFKELLHYSYDYISEVERKVIIPAIQEINDKTRLNVEYLINPERSKITFIFTTQSVLKDNIELNEKYQRLYEKVKKKEEEEQKIIDKNNKNVSYFRHILDLHEEEKFVEGEFLEVKKEDKEEKKSKKENEMRETIKKEMEEELRKSIEKEVREKFKNEIKDEIKKELEEETLSERMERERKESEKDNKEVQEVIGILEKYNVKREDWRYKSWEQLKEMVKKLEEGGLKDK